MGGLIDRTLDIYARHPAARKWQPIVLPRKVDLATWEAYVQRARASDDLVLRELLRVLGYFAAHLALFQSFDNRQALAALRGSRLTLPPPGECYERMVHYCMDTNWGRMVQAPREVVPA